MRFLKVMVLCTLVLGGLVGNAIAGLGAETMARHAQSIKRIGVASAVGDRLQYSQLGFNRFDTLGVGEDISSWGFVGFIEGVLAENLGANGRHLYTVEPIFVDRSKRTAKEIALAAMAAQPANPVDAYVIVEAVQREPAYARIKSGRPADVNYIGGNRPEDIANRAGMGILRDKIVGSKAQYVFITADLVLIDGRGLTEINRVRITALGPGERDGRQADGVNMLDDSRQVKSEARWPEMFYKFSPAELQAISDNMAILWQMSARNSLRQIGLTY